MNTKVAVLIPSYQPDDYFKKCLLSLENQTLSKNDYCVYIALNGRRYPYENFILNVLSKINLRYEYLYIKQAGVSNARNQLIENSKENFIVFIDDDDIVSENYLENLLKVSTSCYMGISNIYNFEHNIKNLKENYIGETFANTKDGEMSKFKTRKFFSSPWAKMIHRDMIKNIRFDTNLFKGEDSLFMATVSKNIQGIHKTTKDTCYYVYEREGSSSRKKIKNFIEVKIALYLLWKYIRLLMKKNFEKKFILTRIVATFMKPFKLHKA